MIDQPLPMEFYKQPTQDLARALLGCLLVKESAEGTASGYIVETEAYMGAEDRAAHSFGNRRTKRTEIMFSAAGHVYTFMMHTHTLVNVVSGPLNTPEAILIRAIEPLNGLDLIVARRGTNKKPVEWTNGPGKLTEALGITKDDYGRLFTEAPLYIAPGYQPEKILSGPRVGIDNTGEARFYPWRYWIADNPYVSATRK
ncbi:DNA-3-methyladenine glycosylase [Sporolactobacillus laevolacticus]|uniref:DNA-3-methyladenine glycosylase n=1 Tax=Sporolactobacillus laevolacticus TaxID=33018 RepID=UPI0025B59FC0|nr:DNA-3-methyladenine glycosylase [Sporolactobacillus laevolacticus]MDN3955131.1 DNA-3-methyladenine glycosylase [Sporolactobacillus laevolacticus]